MNQRSMYRSIAAALLIAMMSLTPAALAQRATRLSAPVESRVVSIGKMIRSGQSRNGTPRFALLDDAGSTTAYVIPRAGANLSVHLNKQVAVTARRSTKSTNGITYLLAEKVTPMGQEPTPAVATPAAAEAPAQVPAIATANPSAMERTPEPLPSISAAPLLPKPEAVPQLAMETHPLAEATGAAPQVSFDEEMLFWEEHDAPKIRRVSHELHPSIMGGVPSAASGPNTVMAHPGVPSEMIVQGDPYMETAGPVLHGAGCAGDCDGSCGLGGACSVPCTSSCCPCGPSGRFWIRAEYLLWWAKGMDTPALVTTTAGTPLAQDAGVLGTDGTSVLYGDECVAGNSARLPNRGKRGCILLSPTKVVAPVGVGRDGETYNINGDTAAGAVAGAMKAERLLLLTDVSGVKDAEGDVITNLTAAQVDRLIADGVIAGGMIPKVETAMDAIQQGVDAVVIMDGRAQHACLLELFTSHGAGTLIKAI